MSHLPEKKFFDILQIYRGIAALLVVIHHTYISFEYYHKLDLKFWAFFASVGKYGVDFFFVLSGFIITYSTFKYRGKSGYLKKYVFNRITRIYIPYLPMGILMLLLYFLMPGLSNGDREISLLTSLTLFPHGSPALAVAWTLTFEMFFYLIYALNFLSKRIWYIFLGIWLVFILYYLFGFSEYPSHAVLSLITSPYNLEFIMGVLIAYLLKSKIRINKGLLLVVFGITSILFFYQMYFDIKFFSFSRNLFFALSCVTLIYMSILYFKGSFNLNHPGMLLGNSSYSLYLTHSLVQVTLVRIIPVFEFWQIRFLLYLMVIMVCCIVGYIYYYIFEKKGIGIVKRLVKV